MTPDDLTPAVIRERAACAHVTINQLMKRAELPNSTFWRWESGEVKEPNPVTRQKILDALLAVETERRAA